MPGFRFAMKVKLVSCAVPPVGLGCLLPCDIHGTWQSQRILISDADELRSRRNKPRDAAIACDIQQTRNAEVDPMQIMRAGLDEPVEIGKAAQLRQCRYPHIYCRQPVAERRSHRDAEAADPAGVHIRTGAKPVECGGKLAQHLARKAPAMPKRGLCACAFAFRGPLAEAWEVNAQHNVAQSHECRAGRFLQGRAAMDQFRCSDGIVVSMCMNVQDRWPATGRYKGFGEQASDHLALGRLEAYCLKDAVRFAACGSFYLGEGMAADLEKPGQPLRERLVRNCGQGRAGHGPP